MNHPYRAAVIQAAPVLFDLEKTLKKTADLVHEAARKGSRLILFPEAFVSVYPRGLSFGTVIGSRSDEGRETWLKLWQSSISVPGPETERLGRMAERAGTFLAIGVNEKDEVAGTLYCTIVYFGPDGSCLGKHRKLKPTAAERIIWGEGDGTTLCSFHTALGKIGGLTCWENYMPLARAAMYRKGVEVYLAPTADSRDSWQHTMVHIALEGRCYVLAANQFVTRSMYPADGPGMDEISGQPEVMARGGSVIISPLGEVLAGPLWDKEGIMTAEIDRTLIVKTKLDFDPVGHYARNDVFDLKVNDQPETVIVKTQDPDLQRPAP